MSLATLNLHGLTKVEASSLVTSDCDASSLKLSNGMTEVTVFMPYSVAAAMAAGFRSPGMAADQAALVAANQALVAENARMLAFIEDVRDFQPEIISGRSRDPQDDVDDMMSFGEFRAVQEDAEALIGPKPKAAKVSA